ncbi:MAG: HAMP domain-containing sensor histidine kinase [Clostridium sp.]
MKSSKTTIRKKIFISHITMITISLLLTFLFFNLYLNFYIKKQTKNQLTEAALTIENSIIESSIDFNTNQNPEKHTGIFEDLKDIESFISFNYSIIGSDMNLIYPDKKGNKDYSLVEDQMMSLLSEKKWLLSKNSKKSVFYFNDNKRQYAAIVHPLKLLNKTNNVYLIVYSDLFKSNGFLKVVNNILILILIITAIVSVSISNNVSKKISKPISLLSNYAKKIGERQYHTEFIKYNINDEIGQLAQTMESMVGKLSTYDTNIKEFIQNASHEIRTPLMSIQGYAEAIKYGVIDDKYTAVDIIIEESKRLSYLVENLLYLSKIESIQDKLNVEEINLEYIIQSSIERVNGIAVNHKRSINFFPNNNNNSTIIIGDEEKLTRAIINILGNCLRYCRENINIILKNEGSKAIIIIEDDGPGFEEEHLNNIFERFFKGNGGKHGIGLTITKSIIEKHNGSITAQNIIKGGARFIITLPLKY